MDLLQTLTSQLGVTNDQARGGAGLLLKLAQEKLGAGEFAQVAKAIPGSEAMMGAAPESGGLTGTLGGLTKALGGGAGQVGDLASLAGGFSALGLDAGMVGKFIPVVLSFAQSQGGDAVRAILEKALR